jgi:hypothetical protein
MTMKIVIVIIIITIGHKYKREIGGGDKSVGGMGNRSGYGWLRGLHIYELHCIHMNRAQ